MAIEDLFGRDNLMGMASISAPKGEEERYTESVRLYFDLWEGAMDAVEARLEDADEDTQRIALTEWWNPHVDGSDVLLEVLREEAAAEGADIGLDLLRRTISMHRADFASRDPATCEVTDSNRYYVGIRYTDEETPTSTALNPLIFGAHLYDQLRQGEEIDLDFIAE